MDHFCSILNFRGCKYLSDSIRIEPDLTKQKNNSPECNSKQLLDDDYNNFEEHKKLDEKENREEKQLVIPLEQYYTKIRPIPKAIVISYSEVTLNLEFEEKKEEDGCENWGVDG